MFLLIYQYICGSISVVSVAVDSLVFGCIFSGHPLVSQFISCFEYGTFSYGGSMDPCAATHDGSGRGCCLFIIDTSKSPELSWQIDFLSYKLVCHQLIVLCVRKKC